MRLSFEVGEERNRVDFSFNSFWGNLAIAVDGVPRRHDFRIFSLRLVKRYELTVGNTDVHEVAIEKERKVFLAGFRKQTYRIFVDGHLVEQQTDY